MPKRKRFDTQRSKVYNGEEEFRTEYRKGSGNLNSVEDCQRFVDSVLARKYVKRHYNARAMTVRGLSGSYNWAHAHGLNVIEIPLNVPGMWDKPVMLHEMAHLLAKRKYGTSMGHNWAFCMVYLDLVRNVLGKEAHDMLRDGFKKHKVRYKKPYQRHLTEEEKAVLRERIKKARLAKQQKAVVD